ncbi:MAG: chemotaxis protein CheX [Myxococcales bacterium]|nr:chemotaxis protein CheX [Myxococcales bacterium]
MDKSDWDCLHQLVADCALALFEGVEIPLEYRGLVPGSTTAKTIAVLGFAGEHLRGAVVLEAPEGVLERSLPCGEPTPEAVLDWAGELANQLCGRIKNRLLGHGIVIQLATPTIISGQVTTVTAEPTAKAAHQFQTDRGEGIAVRFSALPSPEIVFLPLVESSESAVDEGDCLLF